MLSALFQTLETVELGGWVALMETFMKTRGKGEREESTNHPLSSGSLNLLSFPTLIIASITNYYCLCCQLQIKILCEK